MVIMLHIFKLLLLTGCIACLLPCHAQTNSSSSALADSFYFASNWKKASDAYSAVYAQNTEAASDALLLYRLAFCLQNLKAYRKALPLYQKAATASASSPFLLRAVLLRTAQTYALLNDAENALAFLQKAVAAGYVNVEEMDTAVAFANIRKTAIFQALRAKAFAAAYPCMNNAQARQFDFWIGDWDVYRTGTNMLQGHSAIENASGGCMILENWYSVVGPYKGKSMNFVDPATGKWRQVWIGSDGTPGEFSNGVYKDSVMQFESETHDTAGRKIIGRFRFFNLASDRVRQFKESSPDNGNTWTTDYDLTYIRRKKN
jgi:tetratricopeptide (TPR) repeat protein